MARVIHFDLLVKDIDRAISFYTEAFGWKISKWDGPMEYWLISTGNESEPGIDGGLAVGEPNFTTGSLTLDVEDLDGALERATQAGGSVTRERGAIPGVGWFAEVGDTEGNVFGLMESDPRAE